MSISLFDLQSENIIDDAVITATFEGKTTTGYGPTFTAPDDKGSYQLIITTNKDGYEECIAKYWVSVPESKSNLIIPMIIAGVAIVVILVSVILSKRFTSKTKTEQGKEADEEELEPKIPGRGE